MAPTLEDLPEGDRKRFAACWLHSAQETNWDAAFALFDPHSKTKLESFKTVTKRAAAKFGHNKRKKCDAADGDPAPNKKKRATRATRAPRGKKAPTSEEIVSDDRDDTPVKEEAEAEAEAEPEEEEK